MVGCSVLARSTKLIWLLVRRIADKVGFGCRRTLSSKEKHEYINSVKCLASKPSQTGNMYAGAKSRFDDFQVSHIVNTDFIHYVVSLWASIHHLPFQLIRPAGILSSVSATRIIPVYQRLMKKTAGIECSLPNMRRIFEIFVATMELNLIGVCIPP